MKTKPWIDNRVGSPGWKTCQLLRPKYVDFVSLKYNSSITLEVCYCLISALMARVSLWYDSAI